MRILGIDPGLAIVGFGLIEAETGKTQMLQYGAVTTPAGLPLAARLVQLERDMEQLIAQLRGVLFDELERQTGRRNTFDGLLQASHLLERFLRPFAAPDAHAVELVAPG